MPEVAVARYLQKTHFLTPPTLKTLKLPIFTLSPDITRTESNCDIFVSPIF